MLNIKNYTSILRKISVSNSAELLSGYQTNQTKLISGNSIFICKSSASQIVVNRRFYV